MKKIQEQRILFELLPHNNFGKLNWSQFVGEKVWFIRNGKKDYFIITDYDKSNRIMQTDYHGYKSFTYQSSFLKSQISKIIGKKIYGYKFEIGQIIKDLEIIDRMEDDNHHRHYKYKCLIDGNEDWTFEETLNSGAVVCSVCSHQKVMIGINDIPTTDPWMIPYFQGGYNEAKEYMSGSGKLKNFVCPDCGNIRNKKMHIYTLKRTRSIGCACGDGKSYPEKFMYSLLTQLNYTFIDEYSPDWIKPKRYDFYIPSRNLIIEMDGGLGHGKKINSKSGMSIKDSIRIDNFKDDMAQQHGIKVTRIDCDKSDMEFISKNIIDSGIFSNDEIRKISFNECDKYAISNVAKYVCELYEKLKPISIYELQQILRKSDVVIRNYLLKGNRYGWCSYDKEQHIQLGLEKTKEVMQREYSKIVYMYKLNGEYIGEYMNAKELDRQSVKNFGVHLSYKNISRVCNKQAYQYKGYIFTFIKGDIDIDRKFRIYNRPVAMCDKNDNTIRIFKSSSEASKVTNIPSTNITRCCRGERKTAGGCIWKYADEVENNTLEVV